MFVNKLMYAMNIEMIQNLILKKFDRPTFISKKNRWISTDHERDTVSQTSTFVVVFQHLEKIKVRVSKRSRVQLSDMKRWTKLTPIEMKFDIHKIGYLDIHMKEESTDSDRQGTRYNIANMDVRHFESNSKTWIFKYRII